MSDIKSAFQNGKAFIPFVTCGDPDLETTEKLLIEMSKNGADIIEIGIPFSDPIAEGVVIQEAEPPFSFKAGTTTDKIFDMVKRIRPTDVTPFLAVYDLYESDFRIWYGKVYGKVSGSAKFPQLSFPTHRMKKSTSLPDYSGKYGIDVISLIAPTSHERIEDDCKRGRGLCLLRFHQWALQA